MGDHDMSPPPLVSLQSKDHEDLLNIIDTLRSQGISRYIDLPQLIVCGDQSSGKSSVLEAVSGIRFPTKDNLCTRFATELILRRGSITSASVTIVPHSDRSESEMAKLLQFQHKLVDLSQFEGLVDEAKLVMGIEGDAKAFSNDILRVEITSPNQPHLTLVDLPGLFSVGNEVQSDDDAKIVTSLVLSYMKKSRSIILAVVSAKNDFVHQKVTKHAREIDPEGHRTLGIITKPDTLHAGSDSEKSFVELVKNKDKKLKFRLGWHVLRNRDYDTRHVSAEDRDEKERAFFSQGIWTSLPSNHVGISSLKPRLSAVLKEQILTELPSLIEDVIKGVNDCNDILRRLGESRSTLLEQKNHLLRISTEFSSLTKSAIDGTYEAEFFGSAMEEQGYQKRLRAVIQNMCLEFSKVMQHRGHAKQITDNSDASDNPADLDDLDDLTTNHKPKKISRADYIEEVMVLMKRNRGRELPGTYNPMIVGQLFYEQSKNWAEFVRHYTDSILKATRMTLNAILERTADGATGEGLMRYIINPQMDIRQRALEDMVTSVLEPHQRGHPITYNHYFTDNIQKVKAQHRKNLLAGKLWSFFGKKIDDKESHVSPRPFDLKNLLEALSHEKEEGMDRYACSEAIDCMQAYYKVARKSFVDALGVLAVEKCLLEPLPGILSPETIFHLDESTIERIAAETEESRVERAHTNEKLGILRSTLVVLRSLDKHKPPGTRPQAPAEPKVPSSEGSQPHQPENGDENLGQGKDAESFGSGASRWVEPVSTPKPDFSWKSTRPFGQLATDQGNLFSAYSSSPSTSSAPRTSSAGQTTSLFSSAPRTSSAGQTTSLFSSAPRPSSASSPLFSNATTGIGDKKQAGLFTFGNQS